MAQPKGDGYGSLGPCGEVTTLTTNSTTTLDPPSRAIYISTDGTFNFLGLYAAASVTITVYGGAFLPLRVKQVFACPANSLACW